MEGQEWISQTGLLGDTSDEITGIPVTCEYTLQPVDICIFSPVIILRVMLPQSNLWRDNQIVSFA
jgi:hypothetical protein